MKKVAFLPTNLVYNLMVLYILHYTVKGGRWGWGRMLMEGISLSSAFKVTVSAMGVMPSIRRNTVLEMNLVYSV